MSDSQKSYPERKGCQFDIQRMYREFYVGLCVYANRLIKDKSVAEELVQDTFFKLWEKKDTIQIQDSIVPYLFRSVKNNCLNYLKHLKVVNKFNQTVIHECKETEDLVNISQETGLSIYMAQELKDRIYEAIEHLPEQCREIFIMSRFDGMKHQEIAELKGITINTVQKQISIALTKLKTYLNNYLSVILLMILKCILFIK